MSQEHLQLQSKLFKGFADQSRLCILKTILDQPKTVSEIAETTKLSQPNTSMHLACLLDCGLVSKEKNGREVFYRVSTKEIKKMIESCQKILDQHVNEIYQCTRYE